MQCSPPAEQGATLTYGTVLVPLDGSYVAAEALPHATDMARRCGARLVLLHVMPSADEGEVPTRELQAQRAQVETYFAGLKRSLERYGIHVTFVVTAGQVAATIVATASDLDRPLIVMARRGKTAMTADHPGLGSVVGLLSTLWDGPLSLVEPVV